MLLSAVLTLEPVAEAGTGYEVPSFLGRAAHALFLSLVRQAEPGPALPGEGLAASLHGEEGPKPFTASSLLGAGAALPRKGGRLSLLAGRQYHLRLTVLEEALAGLFIEKIMPSLPRELHLEGAVMRVVGVAVEAESHPLAGRESYRGLAQRFLLGPELPAARVGLAFLSPTTFRSQGRNVPLPLPGLVFGSLIERWNAFSPVSLSPEVRRYAEECLAIARFQGQTQLVEVAGGKQVGFVGSCEYVALHRDQYWLRCLNLLAEYAFYAGVGYKTTMGLGQARPFPGSARRIPI